MATRLRKGTSVRVDSLGLSGASLTVSGYRAGGFHTLAFANGNAVPGFYHRDLLAA